MKLLQIVSVESGGFMNEPPFVRGKTRHAPSGVRSTPVQSQQGMLPKAFNLGLAEPSTPPPKNTFPSPKGVRG